MDRYYLELWTGTEWWRVCSLTLREASIALRALSVTNPPGVRVNVVRGQEPRDS